MDDSQALHPQFGAILSAGEVSKGHAKREKRNVKRDKLEHEKEIREGREPTSI